MNFEDITINEADFFAKHSSLIEILPNFDEEALNFLSGSFGPFRPNKPIEVFEISSLERKKALFVLNKRSLYGLV